MEDVDYENSSGEVSDRAKKRCRVVNNLLTSVARDRTEEYWPSVVFARTERSEVCTATNRDKIGSLNKDAGYGYGNATKQECYWLKKEKYSCCTCNTNFRAFFCRTSQNNNVKSPNFRFWRQRKNITIKKSFSVLTLKPFVPIQLRDSSPVLYKVNKTE